MIGKNRRVIASILSVALIASAIPVSGAFAAETTDTSTSTSTSATATTGLAIRNITLKQLLNVPEGSEESNWNLTFAKQMEATDEATYGENFSKDDYVSMIEGIASVMPAYKDMIMNIYNSEDTVVTSTLKDGVITMSADVNGLNAMVNEKVNDQIAAAAGDYADKFGELELKTNLDMTVNLTIDTNPVKTDKTISVTFGAVCGEKTYDLFGMFDLAGAKLGEVKAEFDAFFNDAVDKAEDELKAAEGKLETAKGDIAKAEADIADAKAQGADTTEYEADLAQAKQDYADAEKQIADAKEKLAEAPVKAEEVAATFDRYLSKISSMKNSVGNALELSVVGKGEKADEAYSVLYNAIMSKNGVPQAIKNQIPSSLEGFLASEMFVGSLSFMNNITPAEVSDLLKGATDVTMALENGAFSIIGTVEDEQGTKEVTVKIDASALETASTADIYFNVRMIEHAVVDSSVSETEESDSSDSSVSDSDVSSTDDTDVTSVSETDDTGSSDTDDTDVTSVSETDDTGSSDTDDTDVTSVSETDDTGSSDTDDTDVTSVSETDDTDVTSVSETYDTINTDDNDFWKSALTDNSGKYRAAILGDVNLEFDVKAETALTPTDAVNSLDALMILQSVVGLTDITELQMVAGDVDFNGEVNAVDALSVLQFTVGSVTSFKDAGNNEAAYFAVKFDDALSTIIARQYYKSDMTISPIAYTEFVKDDESAE